MFDAKSYKTLLKIRAAEDADAILYDPASKHVFSFNGDANVTPCPDALCTVSGATTSTSPS